MAAFSLDNVDTSQPIIGESDPMINNANVNDPDLAEIRQILSHHDPQGKVSKHIVKCLIKDGLTLSVLCNFDDLSLQETIDSWNIQSCHKKPHIIRGLLISSIKNMKHVDIPSGNNRNCNIICNHGLDSKKIVLTEKEANRCEQLAHQEKMVRDKLESFENDSKTRETVRDELYNEYGTKINSSFDNLINKINLRRNELLNQLKCLFDDKDKQYNDYSNTLKQFLLDIDKCRIEYEKNLSSMNSDIYYDIQQRSEKNCKLIEQLLQRIENFDVNINDQTKNSNEAKDGKKGYECNIAFDNDKMNGFVSDFGSISRKSVDINTNGNTAMVDHDDHDDGDHKKDMIDQEEHVHAKQQFDAKIVKIEHPGNLCVNERASIRWIVKNTGSNRFGNNVKFKFVSGDALLLSNYEIPNADVNETVSIKLNFIAMEKAGFYQSQLRLCRQDPTAKNNHRCFGEIFKVDLNVLSKELAEKVQSLTGRSISPLHCICGEQLVYIESTQAYKKDETVYCDKCPKDDCKGWVFHCPKGKCKDHKGGWDLCQDCANVYLRQQDQGQDRHGFIGSGLSDLFLYPEQLNQLTQMGFNSKKSRRLLMQYRGDIATVLQVKLYLYYVCTDIVCY